MTALKKLLGDFADKRLWPVAVVLVAALVAVPMLLGHSSSGEPVAAAPAAGGAATSTPTSRAAVELESSADEAKSRGAVHNPFKGPKVAKPKVAETPKTTSSGSGSGATPSGSGDTGSGDTGSGDTGSGDTDSGGSGGSDTTGDTTTKNVDVSRVSLHLGPLGALITYKDVARLSPLPSAANPQFVFTGVLKDGKTAVLLPSSTIQIDEESDVECKPSNKSCQRLEVQADDTVFFKILGDAQGVQYQLDVISVRLKSGGSARASAAALKRHSNAGAAALRDAHVNGTSDFKGAADYRWMPDTGLLARVPEHGKAHASANGATAASADDAAAALPGLPVWHWTDGS
jgi:hypothetical protein